METFIPKEALKKVRRAEKEEKPTQLQEFKEKLAYQKEGLARIQELLTGIIRDNPDTPLEDLETFVNQSAPEYGLSNEQKGAIALCLKAYTEKHKAVNEIRSKHPKDDDLFEALFGRPPQWKVEIIEGPMTLYVRAHDERDYAYIYSYAFLQKRAVKSEDIEAANLSGGISIGEALIEGLEGTIIAENTHGRSFNTGDAKDIYIHEEQHAIKRLFKETYKAELFGYKLARAKTDEEKERILKSHLRRRRQYGDSWVKDEILAFLKMGSYNGEKIYAILTRPEENGGLYNYFKDKDKIARDTFNYIMKAKEAKGIQQTMQDLSWLSLIERTVKDVYETEYHQLILEGIAVFERLRDKGYSMEQTIALLINEPLAKWRKVARRLWRSG